MGLENKKTKEEEEAKRNAEELLDKYGLNDLISNISTKSEKI